MTVKIFTIAALGALAAVASPAAAQWSGNVVDTQSLRAEIDAGVARGDISSEEAYSLRSQLRGLINLQRQYEQDGLTRSEREDLRQRAMGLRNEIRGAGGYASGYGTYGNGYNGYNRGYNQGYGGYNNGYSGYGNGSSAYGGAYNNGYGTYSYGGTYNNGTYGNGTYGYSQYGRSDDSRYDRDDDAYDRDDDGYALRVGERVSGGLYAVPDAYRYRFRDGGGVYYRYGNGNVYQIDARTGIVLRIYSIGR